MATVTATNDQTGPYRGPEYRTEGEQQPVANGAR
jgi:hypothetical protein